MSARALGTLALLLLLSAAAIIGFQQVFEPNRSLRDQVTTLTDQLPSLALPDISITTPGPLRGRTDAPANPLTIEGILRETNRHRAEAGLSPLTLNAKLSAAAQAKVNDMFRQQYFEHIGPDGRGPSDWVDDTGYGYIAVGENLALGNFASDAELVQAWMNSPGHRANILNRGFQEIGLAATAGTFEDNRTWLSVQTFATPASACPTPSNTLRTQYEQGEEALDRLRAELDATRAELDQLADEHDRLVREGNAKIEEGNQAAHQGDRETAEARWAEGEALHTQARQLEGRIRELETTYNQLVDRYNTEREELLVLNQKLNAEINTYNTCLSNLAG